MKIIDEKNLPKGSPIDLVRPEILSLSRYKSARSILSKDEKKVFIDANELGYSPIDNILSVSANRYPDPQPKYSAKNLAEFYEINPNKLVMLRGSDDGIDCIIRTFCRAYQDHIMIMPPTYGVYSIFGDIQGVNSIEVPLLKGSFGLNSPEILKKITNKVKVIFLCNPNNPTGNVISVDEIENLLKLLGNKSVLVIDEAYIEFCPNNSSISLIKKYPNLVVLRTLSKAFGLAGLRLGNIIADERLIEQFHKIRAPYPISSPTTFLLEEFLKSNFRKTLFNNTKKIAETRDYLVGELKKFKSIENIYPSSTNFVLFEIDNAKKLFESLFTDNIIVRYMGDKLFLDNCLRISIGTRAEIELFIEILGRKIN